MVKCLTPDCGRDEYARGICQKCYNAASRMVKSGKVSWERLLELGAISNLGRSDPNYPKAAFRRNVESKG